MQVIGQPFYQKVEPRLEVVIGAVYFVYDTVQNEERWTRSVGHWLETLVAGPIIWVLLVLIAVVGRGLMLFEYLQEQFRPLKRRFLEKI